MDNARKPQKLPPPEEWDFRTVPEDQLEYAIFYEYARLSPWIVWAFRDWHGRILELPQAARTLRKWNGLTFGAALRKMEGCEAPWEVHEAVSGFGPENIVETPDGEYVLDPRAHMALSLLRLLNPLFPVPFLRSPDMSLGVSVAKETMPLSPSRPVFCSLEDRRAFLQKYRKPGKPPIGELYWDDPEYVKRMHLLGVRKFEVIIDFRHSKTVIKEHIARWIDKLDTGEVKKFVLKKGMGSTPPWHESHQPRHKKAKAKFRF